MIKFSLKDDLFTSGRASVRRSLKSRAAELPATPRLYIACFVFYFYFSAAELPAIPRLQIAYYDLFFNFIFLAAELPASLGLHVTDPKCALFALIGFFLCDRQQV